MPTPSATYRLRLLRTGRVYRLERPRPQPGLLDQVRHWWRRRGR